MTVVEQVQEEEKQTFNKKWSNSIGHIDTADGLAHILAGVSWSYVGDKQTADVAVKLGHQAAVDAEVIGDKPVTITPPVDLQGWCLVRITPHNTLECHVAGRNCRLQTWIHWHTCSFYKV